MKWFSKFSFSNDHAGLKKSQQFEISKVEQLTNTALKDYKKTFEDLARYDRGEKTPDAVSR